MGLKSPETAAYFFPAFVAICHSVTGTGFFMLDKPLSPDVFFSLSLIFHAHVCPDGLGKYIY